MLETLSEYIQDYFIKYCDDLIKKNFALIYQKVFDRSSLRKLYDFCIGIVSTWPEILFKSFDYTDIKENALVSLLKSDDLQIQEIDIWKYVLNWGLAQNPASQENLTWTDEDFAV